MNLWNKNQTKLGFLTYKDKQNGIVKITEFNFQNGKWSDVGQYYNPNNETIIIRRDENLYSFGGHSTFGATNSALIFQNATPPNYIAVPSTYYNHYYDSTASTRKNDTVYLFGSLKNASLNSNGTINSQTSRTSNESEIYNLQFDKYDQITNPMGNFPNKRITPFPLISGKGNTVADSAKTVNNKIYLMTKFFATDGSGTFSYTIFEVK